jgi:hypothetical protein
MLSSVARQITIRNFYQRVIESVYASRNSLYTAKSYFAERISNAHSFVLRSFISTFTGGRKGVEYLQSILADLLRIT